MLLNYWVDPAGIYHDANVSPDRYASKLVKSKNGLLWPEGMFAGRELAKALSRMHHGKNCVVIGSSHVMQVSSERQHKSFGGECSEILNLGVSGASIEDHITLAYLVLNSGYKGKVVFGVDPWTLAYGRDKRWLKYREDYQAARDAIFSDVDPSTPTKTSILPVITNLLSIGYLKQSLVELKRLLEHGELQITEPPSFDHKKGLTVPVKLSDGSHIYSQSYIEGAEKGVTLAQGVSHTYKVVREVSSIRGVSDYRHLMGWTKKSGATPAILLTPYHPFAWVKKGTRIHDAMVKTEDVIHGIANQLGVQVYGSYDPRKVGCKEFEFYDVMHAKDACLEKISVRLQ